jgi:hypothetical protein
MRGEGSLAFRNVPGTFNRFAPDVKAATPKFWSIWRTIRRMV